MAAMRFRMALWAAAAPLLALYAYAVAGLAGGSLAAPGWRARPAAGVTIWVENNGVHTGLVLPLVSAGVDWRPIARPGHLRDPRLASDWLAIGWGDRDFYVNTPTWAEVDPLVVARAAIGSPTTIVHLEHLGRPVAGQDVRPLVLRPEEYRRLAAFVRASFATGDGRLRWRHGYARHDVFYAGTGRYSAYATCNEWTGAALRVAGVRMGRWTPFPVTVMGWL